MSSHVVTVFSCGTLYSREEHNEAIADMFRWCTGRKWVNDGPGNPDHAIPKIEHLFDEARQPSWFQRLRGKGPYSMDSHWGSGGWGGVKGTRGIAFGRGTQDNVLITLQWLWEQYHSHAPDEGPFTVCNLVGWSRGAVTCLAIANAMEHAGFGGLGIHVNIFAYDPVPGGQHDFGTHGDFESSGRAGFETIPGIVNQYHSILMENEGGIIGPLFKCISPREMSQETHKREYPLPGEHADCVEWNKPNNPAGTIGLSLGLEFLLRHGTTFSSDAGDHFLTHEDMLEEYSKLRRNWLEKCGWKQKQRSVAWMRSGTVINEWRDNLYFMNGHHFETFKQATPLLFQAATSTRTLTAGQVASLKSQVPLTISVLRYLEVLRDPGSRAIDQYQDVVFQIEVNPTPQEINEALNPLRQALTHAQPYDKHNPPGSTERLWSMDQWHQASHTSWGRRKEQVEEIDRLLSVYHKGGQLNLVGQFRILFPLAKQLTSHLNEKGTKSNRHVAVAQLGRQVLHALQHPPTTGKP